MHSSLEPLLLQCFHVVFQVLLKLDSPLLKTKNQDSGKSLM